jgi:hypothetical protein
MSPNQLRRKTPAELVDMLCLPEDPDPWVAGFVASMREKRNQQGNDLWLTVPQIMKIRELIGDKVAKRANRIYSKRDIGAGSR